MKVLITAPSLDENKNVSGISTLVGQIIKNGKADFFHFQAGRQDDEKGKFDWIFKQFFLVPRFHRQIKMENVDLVHINTALNPLSILRDYALVKTARFAGRKIVLHLHGGEFLAREFKSVRLKKLAEKMLQSANAIIVLSELEKQIIERRWRDLNVRVLENAVSIEEVKPQKMETPEKTIIFLGRLHESKGLHEIIEACRILKEENYAFLFRCFGAGELKDFFAAEMTKILGDKFYYGGVVSGKKKWDELAASDIFLLPSRYGEGLPIAMLEAMAAQCIVIAADVASVRAVVEDGVNGFLIEPYNTAQIVSKLKHLLSDEIDWKILQRNARATIEEKYAIADYIKKLESLYAATISP
ncbi:MAG TPA: glycosyltransferase family 4 protein [Pyrinomonadaceae bacterium]|nr:glycosyltransferase family 4 protein [Pyrinomonadaceae bacterium]